MRWADRPGGLKPTYEGWKLGKNPDSSSNIFGLKPTYEGWKQAMPASRTTALGV